MIAYLIKTGMNIIMSPARQPTGLDAHAEGRGYQIRTTIYFNSFPPLFFFALKDTAYTVHFILFYILPLWFKLKNTSTSQ